MKEDEQAVQELKLISDQAKNTIETFHARIGTLYDHKKIVRELMSLLLVYKTAPANDIKEQILNRLERIRAEIMPVQAQLYPEFVKTTEEQLAKGYRQELHDIGQLEEDVKNEAIGPAAKEKIQSIIKGLREEINQKREDVNLVDHIQELGILAKKFSEQERMLIKEELALLEKTEKTLPLRNPTEYDSLAYSWRIFMEDLDILLRQEKTDVIDHFGALFKEPQTIASKVKKLFSPFAWIKEKRKPTPQEMEQTLQNVKITAEDIARDLETFTTPGETQKYDAYLKQHWDLLSEDARRLLTRGGLAAGERGIIQEARLSRLAFMDPLTGLYTRKVFDKRIDAEFQRMTQGRLISVIFIDIDHFKIFNDTYGHHIGDTVLAFVGDIIKHAVRPGDVACRWGGEEMVVLLSADKASAVKVAERIRESVQEQSKALLERINADKAKELAGKPVQLFITVSLGVATAPEDENSAAALEHTADKRLYAAKSAGRNCIVAN